MGDQMQFEVLSKQDGLTVGKLDGEAWSGVYLTSEFLDRLAEVHGAAQTRLATLSQSDLPDAVRNLLGILTRVFASYGTAVQDEQAAHHKAAWEALEKARSMLEDLR